MIRVLKVSAIIILVIGIITLAGALRWRAVQQLPPDYDEDDYLRAGQLYTQGIRQGDWGVFLRENYRPEHPPLSKIVYGFTLLTVQPFPLIPDASVQAAINQSLPEEPLRAARTASAVINLLEVAILAVINPLAGFFQGIHTFTIKYTSQVMLEGLPTLTSLLVVVFYSRYIKTGRKRAIWWVLSGVFLGLTAASKYYYALSGLAVASHWLWTTRIQERKPSSRQIWQWLSPVLLWGVISLVIFFAADPYLWPDPIGRLKESVFFHGGYATSDQVREANLPWWQPLNWLMTSVPWHPGVFVIAIDIIITLFAVAGITRARQKYPVYMLWLAFGLGFLLVWPTKWAQYILLITAPLSLSAAEGFKVVLIDPSIRLINRLRHWIKGKSSQKSGASYDKLGKVMPWLLPGLVALLLITVFPLIFQLGISMTDFQSSAIKDGVNGGVFREVWKGISGQVEPNLAALNGGRPTKVHYAGLRLLLYILLESGPIYVFEFIWTSLAVVTQLALGVTVALLLHRKGIFLNRAWKTLFILPWAVPEFVAALTWSQIFDSRFGYVALAAQSWSQQVPAIANFSASWQQNSNFALVVLLTTALWYGFPIMLLSALAGLKMIPNDVFDAAAMDGASGFSLFKHITWPLMFPLLVPALIIRAIFAFNQFYLFAVMQTPDITFSALSYFIFGSGNYAVSAAFNVVTVIILIGLVTWFNRMSKAGEGVSYA